ncbi:MAG: DUF1501 domain-containing protein [Acidobacteria bacterium]|nr:DUF1501 domain-containing protein [Acidobacteriota bacterium]
MKDRFGFDWSKIQGTHFWARPQLSRRLFFRHAASALGGYFLLPVRPMETVARAAGAPMGTAKNCIFILMSGAPSHVDTFDLKEGAWTPPAFNPTSYGNLRFPQALLPNLAAQIDSLAFVRSVRSWAAVHSLAQTWVQIGRNPVAATSKIAPHIGSVASLELRPGTQNKTLPTFLALNTGADGPEAGYLSPEHAPFFVTPNGNGLGNTAHPAGQARFDTRFNLLQTVDAEVRSSSALGAAAAEMSQFNLSARKLMYNPAVDRVFAFDAAERARYGNSGFGNACIAARNLLRANMGTRFIQISIGGWDHHSNIYQANAGLTTLSRTFDNGLGTLIADLENEGRLADTLIVAMGEFGRTVGPLNNQNGRDHYLQQAVLFAGAGIKGGRAIGATDGLGRGTTDPGWSRGRDVRAEDIEATIYSALGIDWTTVRRDDPLGRGFEYVPFSSQDLYGPVHELWG